jgi:hypothetical protein
MDETTNASQPTTTEGSTRTARCSYYGTTNNKGKRCMSERPSSDVAADLAFFTPHPDKAHDEFYCGCWGWE